MIFLTCFLVVLMQFYGCSTGALMSENVDLKTEKTSIGMSEISRHKKDKTEGGLMEKILPLLITPFLISSALIPIMLMSIKILMAKSFFVGKIAVVLMLLNFFRRRTEGGGVYDHHISGLAHEHYGYQGIDEPGIYVHKRRRKR